MTENQQQNIVETALAAGRELAAEMQYENGTPYLVIPDNHSIHEFDNLRENPIRIEQRIKHTTAQSFIDYYNRFADSTSAIFIDELNNRFTAILDYHDIVGMAGWKGHMSTFELMKTPEWQTWEEKSGKPMTQADFAQFIENNLTEIITPTGADMLEMALTIQAKTDVKFSSSLRLDNGQTQLTYNEVVDGTAGAKGQIKIPEKFTIGLKLFRGGEPYQIDARLRYRIKEGNLSIWYELIRPHAVVDANINDTLELISKSIQLGKIYKGVPE